MYNDYRSGVADDSREFTQIADYAATMPHTYGPDHADWAYGKLFTRMESGLAIPYPSIYGSIPVAVTVAYPEPAETTTDMPSIEIKLWRTAPSHEGWGQGRVTMKGAVNETMRRMGLMPGTVVRTHLDTRNPTAMQAFQAMGFQRVAEVVLYDTDPTLSDQTDVVFERYVTVPDNLYDR